MVVQNAATMARPRRQAAIEGVKAATGSLTQRAADNRAKAKPAAATAPAQRKTARRQRAASASEADDSSELSESSDDDDDDDEGESSMSELSEPEYDMDDSGTFGATAKKGRASGDKGKNTAARRATRTRKEAPTTKSKKTPGKPARRQRKATKTKSIAKVSRRVANKEDLPIHEDNKLFNCVKSSTEDLKTVAEDWVAYYTDNAPAALAQFVNFLLRSSSCNETVDEVQAEDTDDIVPVLSQIQDSFKGVSMPSYPLVSRSQAYKRFRRNLGEFIEHIFTAATEADAILDDKMLDILIAWIGSMSSSGYRAFRHTATVFALFMVGQIGRLSQDARLHFEQLAKTRDAEKRKVTPAQARALDDQVKDADAARKELDTYLKDLMEAVYHHRFRDADPAIRVECVEELGRWMKTLPAQFLTRDSLLYSGWTLTDPDERIRLATVHSLCALYSRHGLRGSLRIFTERFVPRFQEMAVGDIDVNVRVAAVNLMAQVYKQGAVDDESRDALATHIFDIEPRVRLAVARFVSSVLEQGVADEEEADIAGKRRFKELGALVARLHDRTRKQDEEFDADSSRGSFTEPRSRISMALGDLWSVWPAIQDWTPLLELLQLDHTVEAHQPVNRIGRRRTGQQMESSSVEDVYQLESTEESVLVEALPVFLQKAQESSKGQHDVPSDDDTGARMTKELMPILTKLFNKYRTEAARIRDVLRIPCHMRLSLYMEHQQLGSYEEVWKQVVDQFERHTEKDVLHSAVEAISALSSVTVLSDINAAKLQRLREKTVDAFKAVASISATTPGDDGLGREEITELQLCTRRLCHLIRLIDISDELEYKEDEISPSGWDQLLKALAMDYTKEGNTISINEDALTASSIHVMWKTRTLMRQKDSDERDLQVAALADKRHDLLGMLEATIEDRHSSRTTSLARHAYGQLLALHVLFSTMQAVDDAQGEGEIEATSSRLPEKLRLMCEGSLQDRLAVFVAEEMERYEEEMLEQDASSASAQTQVPALLPLQRQQELLSVISPYAGAIRLGVLELRHAVPLCARYGRLGDLFDASLRVVVDAIRDAGIFDRRAHVACRVVLDSLMKTHGTIQNDAEREAGLINLSKLLSSCLVVRGAQLAITHTINATAVVAMHERALAWVTEHVKDAAAESESAHALVLLKALANLLVSVDARDALAIKASMDRALARHGIEVPAAGRAWDPLRAYEKRLVTIASKSDAVTRQVQRRPADEQESAPGPGSPAAADLGFHQPQGAATDIISESRARWARASFPTNAGLSDADGEGEDEEDVESVLGNRGRQQDGDSLAGLTLDEDERDDGMDVTSELSVPALDLTANYADAGDDEEAESSLAPPARRTRRRASGDDDADMSRSTRTKRSKRS